MVTCVTKLVIVLRMKYVSTLFFIVFTKMILAQQVIDVSMSNSDMRLNVAYMHRTRLLSKELVNDTLHLKIGLARRSTDHPGIELDRRGDSLIIDIQTKHHLFSRKMYYCELNITAIGIRDTSFAVYEKYLSTEGDSLAVKDGNLVFLVEREIVNYYEVKAHPTKFDFPLPSEVESATGDNRRVNDSLKVGYWIVRNKLTRVVKSKAYYVIDESSTALNGYYARWYAIYDRKGKLEHVCGCKGIDPNGYPWYTCLNQEQYEELKLED